MSQEGIFTTISAFSRPRKTVVLAALIAMLLTAAAVVGYGDPGRSAVGEVDGSRPRQAETRNSPKADAAEPLAIRWLTPQPKERLTGSVELRWEVFRQEITVLDVWIDERHLLQVAPTADRRVINTKYLSNGPHRLELRAIDKAGRSLRASVDVRVHNSDFSILRVSRPQTPLKNGEEFMLEVTTRGSGFEPQADFTAADSAFDARQVSWNQLSPTVYRLRYRLSSKNERPDGSYRAQISLVDQTEPSIRKHTTTRIEVRNTPLFSNTEPPVEISCGKVFRPDPLLPSDETTRTLERIEGPARVVVGEPVNLRLHWAPLAADGQRFLKVSVDGVKGYFALHGACSQRDEIPLVALRPSGAEGYRIAIWPRNGLPVVHRLIAVP